MTGKKTSPSRIDPLTRPLLVTSVHAGGIEVEVAPDATELTSMAAFLDLAVIEQLKAKYQIAPRGGDAFQVTGTLEALVQPYCVMSMEPFPLKLKETIALTFAPPRDEEKRRPEEEDSNEDPPDVLENGIIDLGHVTTEFLSLSLPDYPRKPGASFGTRIEDEPKSPFAALSQLKAPKDEK